MTGGATFARNPAAEAASAFAALTFYGNETSGNSFNLDNAQGATFAGSNAGSFNLNGGGSVYVGSGNSASINVNGGRGSVSINGNNGGTLTLNNGGTVKVNGNAGNGTLNGGSLTYTGSIGSWNLNGGASSNHVPSLGLPPPSNPLPSFASTFQQPLTALSSQLAALTPNSSVVTNGNNVILEAHPGAGGVAVLALTTSVFASNDTVSVALSGAITLIVNLSVAGCSSN